jgi:hypothetical protein
MEAALRVQPYLCFERCSEGWKESPINVKRKGVLHESWASNTVSCRVVQVAERGMYMNTHLQRVRFNVSYNFARGAEIDQEYFPQSSMAVSIQAEPIRAEPIRAIQVVA